MTVDVSRVTDMDKRLKAKAVLDQIAAKEFERRQAVTELNSQIDHLIAEREGIEEPFNEAIDALNDSADIKEFIRRYSEDIFVCCVSGLPILSGDDTVTYPDGRDALASVLPIQIPDPDADEAADEEDDEEAAA